MTFTQFYDSSALTISSSFGNTAYQSERNYFKILFKNIVSTNKIVFNGYTYTAYRNYEEVIIEVTDIIRSSIDESSFVFFSSENTLLASLDITIFAGFKQNSITKINLPSEIKLNLTYFDKFYIDSSYGFDVKVNGVWVLGYKSFTITNINTEIRQNSIPIKLTSIDTCKKVLFRWISSNGIEKDWYLLQDKLNYSSDKSLQIDTGDSDYRQFKNKKISFSVIERMADLSTQKYLSDLVISDDVKVYIDGQWMPVSIETNNVEVHHKRRDLIFNVNFKHYDTI